MKPERNPTVDKIITALLLATVVFGLITLTGPERSKAQGTFPGMTVVPLGYCQLTSLAAAKGFADCSGGIPTGANEALIVTEAQAIRYRDDGTAPTASIGFPVAVGVAVLYTSRLTSFSVIEQTSGAKLNVLFYKSP